MTKVNCSVDNCSYNKEQCCYAERVAVGGQGATDERVTCCGTFLNKAHYSNLAEHTEYKSVCDAVSCMVGTCRYNENHACKLESIQVIGEDPATLYVDTDCSSFEAR